MNHAEAITDRILLLDGLPELPATVLAARRADAARAVRGRPHIEYDVLARLKPGVVMCRQKEDATSAGLLEAILADEEQHIDYLETQLQLMDKLGEQLYSAQCVVRPPHVRQAQPT